MSAVLVVGTQRICMSTCGRQRLGVDSGHLDLCGSAAGYVFALILVASLCLIIVNCQSCSNAGCAWSRRVLCASVRITHDLVSRTLYCNPL